MAEEGIGDALGVRWPTATSRSASMSRPTFQV